MLEVDFSAHRWPAHIAEQVAAAYADQQLSDGDMYRLDRWRRHLEGRGGAAPTPADCLAMGGLSTLERLSRALRIIAPDEVPPFRIALQIRRREKRARTPPVSSGRLRGREPRQTAPLAALPDILRGALAEMNEAAMRRSIGYAPKDDRTPPTRKQVRFLTGVLRRLAHACIAAGRPIAIDRDGVTAWIDAAEEKGRKAAGIAAELKAMRRVLLWVTPKQRFANTLRALIKTYTKRARLQRKRKANWLLKNPTDLGSVWNMAEDLLKTAQLFPVGSCARHALLLEAAALAFTICCPLRIGDVHRVKLGVHLCREPFGWMLGIGIEKTEDEYERDALWPELTPFLDALVTADVAGGDLWRGYEERIGTWLFSRDGGASGLGETWLSDVWRRHVGTGAHVVRTLWHELAREGEIDETWIALALCGQRDPKTARAYKVRNRTERARRSGRAKLRARRNMQTVDPMLRHSDGNEADTASS